MNINEAVNSCNNVELKEWAANKSWPEIYRSCHRGDWLLCLFTLTNPENMRLLTFVTARCANTVRHLMKDQQSIAAIDAAIAYTEGKMSNEHLISADSYAYNAYVATYDIYSAAKAVSDASHASYVTAQAAEAAFPSIATAKATVAAGVTSIADAITEYTEAAGAYAAKAAIISVKANDAVAYAAEAVGYAAMAAYYVYATQVSYDADCAYTTAKKANQLLTANIVRQYIPIDKWNITD